MMQAFPIEKGVAIPPRTPRGKTGTGLNSRFDFASMVIGDSFFVPNGNPLTLASAATEFAGGHSEFVFTTKWLACDPVHGIPGARVWRVAKQKRHL